MSKKYKYMRKDTKDEYGIKELQDKILEIISYIDKLCKENNITYFLMGGSALGAVRHNGFIPWDDDLDICMDYRNFKKFEEICKTKLDTKKYYYQAMDTEEFPHFYAKLRANNTTYIEKENLGRKMHQGIFVDIFCLFNVPQNKISKKIQQISASLLNARALSKYKTYKANNITKKIAIITSKVVVNGPIKKILLTQVYKWNKQETQTKAQLFTASNKGKYYPAELFEKQRYVRFETIKLPVPSGVEEYLKIVFGENYMDIPPIGSKNRYTSHQIYWNTKIGYEEYYRNEN